MRGKWVIYKQTRKSIIFIFLQNYTRSLQNVLIHETLPQNSTQPAEGRELEKICTKSVCEMLGVFKEGGGGGERERT